MRVAVFVLALIGGIIGILGTIAGAGLAGATDALGGFTEAEATEAGGRIFLGFLAGVLTLVFGSLVFARKWSARWWGVALLATNLVGSFAAGGFYMFGGFLGIVAGLLALFISRQPANEPQTA